MNPTRTARGHVTLVGAGPGAADLITVRGLRALEAADVILYDALVAPELLDDVQAQKIYVGKRCGCHAMKQPQIIELMIRLAREGQHVVRLKGGDPMVLGRGGEEGIRLAEEGIPFDIVPGVTSCVAGPELGGIPVTFRGVADSFVVLTAHRRKDEADFSIPPFQARTTVVLLMGVGTAPVWRSQMRDQGYPADLPVAFVMSAGAPEQRVVETTLETLTADMQTHNVESPAVAVVGHVVSLRAALTASAHRLADALAGPTGPAGAAGTMEVAASGAG